VVGTGIRSFTITAPHLLTYQFGCLGHHLVWVRASSAIGGGFAVRCYDTGGVFGGEILTIPRIDIGEKITIHVDAPGGSTWRLRMVAIHEG
jgi:hypothetical protein